MNVKDSSLSLAQLLVLSTAAPRPDHMIMPLPATLKARGASQKTLLNSLLKGGYVEEAVTIIVALSWRQDDGCQHQALRLTEAGLAAVGVSEGGELKPAAEANGPQARPSLLIVLAGPTEKAAVPVTPETRRPSGKLGEVLTALEGQCGATLADLVTLTGWLPHTTRAALTRLRQRGFVPQRVTQDGRQVYRVEPRAAA